MTGEKSLRSGRSAEPRSSPLVPRPSALRLEARDRAARPPRPPFGLDGWKDEADAIGVVLDASACDVEDPGAVAGGLPDPTSLPPGTRVYVLGVATRGAGFMARLRGLAHVARVTRCTAFLARGYVGIGAGTDEATGADLAWGEAP